MVRSSHWRAAVIGFGLFAASAVGAQATTLRASHQFPGGKGDVRDEMLQIIARDVKADNVDLEIQIYPGASLFKPNAQWDAMVKGQLDMTSLALDYASGKVPAFSVTLMPALVRNQEHARAMNHSPFMAEIHKIIEQHGVLVLADAWLAGAFGAKKGCITTPEDVKGLKFRSAGPSFAAMWAGAGASIAAMPSNEVYNALQTGVIDATDTSTASFVSFRLYEQLGCVTAPGDNALWFMYEPVLMSKRSFDRLNPAQQKALLTAGKKSEEYFYTAAKTLDDAMVQAFTKADRKVVTVSPEDFARFRKVAEGTSYKQFAAEVPEGRKLLDLALAVK